MASTKTVIVLAPNGRRQNVKVTLNTTILQIVEEVCKKQGLKPEEHDIKHHNHILDVSSIIRFSGLPNNAQLELCAIQRAREESSVILGIQLEDGTRLTGNYFPCDNLLNVLTQLCPDQIQPEKNPVVIYMRQEIYGSDVLQNTSLKSLGITGGRAMLRLIHRKPEELKMQANVSAPLPSKPPEEKPFMRKLQRVEREQEESIKLEDSKPASLKQDNETFKEEPISPTQKKNFLTDFIKKEKSKKTSDAQKIKNPSARKEQKMEVDSNPLPPAEQKAPGSPEIPDVNFAFIGERNALAFSLDMAQSVPHEDLPDEFFELTLQDARKLLHDLKKNRVQLEEAPLQTATLRNLEQDKKTLRHLSQYKKTVIRVQFPDRTVLQGTFKPLETVGTVMNFVKEYLEDSSKEFHLYTTPPKSILKSEVTLLDAECVPSVVVHFGLNELAIENTRFLQQSLLNKFTSHSLASLAAARSRGDEVNRFINDDFDEEMDLSPSENIHCAISFNDDAGPSTSDPGPSRSPRSKSNEPKEKVPKWFKPNK